ncbi:MAG: cell division protein FtsL, partial [Lachnospiraceae bacterium]|nr:cell division protein FtsL [Lachnospiraceae bacterium]
NNLKQDNDEAYNRASGNVDLDEVKRIAIQEYGMTYATEGQIVRYSDEGGNDYVRQLAPIPEINKN